MVTFDDVLPALVRTCETYAGATDFIALKTACVVRDLKGKVRMIVDPEPGKPPFDTGALANVLTAALGAFFVPPVWSTQAQHSDEARLARAIRDQATSWGDAAYKDATGLPVQARASWKKLERRLSKQEWLETTSARLPWPLREGKPAIVTFYSFKGGVGRTTALAACAWQLARAAKRVVIIDLDLEAPGIGTLLEVQSERGVIDVLVDALVTDTPSLAGALGKASALGADGERVEVLPAGELDLGYLEKLGRLDFLGANVTEHASSPIEAALRALLHAVAKRTPRPDYILLDSRAGLHDLAGLSLHRLAHIDVLVGRAGEQGYRGLDLTLRVLAQRKGAAAMRCIVVHTLAPTAGTPPAIDEEREFKDASFESFKAHVYSAAEAETLKKEANAMHVPLVIRRDLALERFTKLSFIERSFFEPGFEALREKIVSLGTPTPGAEEP